MWILPVICVLFLSALWRNLSEGRPLDFINLWLPLIFSLASGLAFFFLRKERIEAKAFDRWISQHLPEVMQGGARYHNLLVTPETEFRRQQFVASFLVVSVKLKTCYVPVQETGRARVSGLACSAATLVLGWWGLPWGPIFTLWALGVNARGGERVRFRQLVEEAAEKRKKERLAAYEN